MSENLNNILWDGILEKCRSRKDGLRCRINFKNRGFVDGFLKVRIVPDMYIFSHPALPDGFRLWAVNADETPEYRNRVHGDGVVFG